MYRPRRPGNAGLNQELGGHQLDPCFRQHDPADHAGNRLEI